MTVGDRQRLVAHLEMTEAWLDSEVNGLSDAQLNFKMTPESWSVEEVVDAPRDRRAAVLGSVQRVACQAGEARLQAAGHRRAMLWYGIDRTQRTTTGEARVPRDQFPDLKASLASFKKLRAEMMKTAKEIAGGSARPPIPDREPGSVSWFLMISTHSQRHIMQIREVKAHKDFPKK